MIFILVLALLASLCVILLNSKYIGANSQKVFASKYSFSKINQEWYMQFIPSALHSYVENNLIYTKLDKDKFYKELFYSVLVSIFIFIAYCFSFKTYLLGLSLLVLCAVIADFAIKVDAGKKSFIDSLDHLISCLEILTVKSETPLANALKIVCDSLPEEFYVARNELNKILQQAEKFGMEQVLNDIEKDSIEEQEFISILIAIQKGTNKSALKKNLQDFLLRQKAIKEEKRKLIVENLQLYMMLPGTVMLIIAMFPMIDMIASQLQGVFQ